MAELRAARVVDDEEALTDAPKPLAAVERRGAEVDEARCDGRCGNAKSNRRSYRQWRVSKSPTVAMCTHRGKIKRVDLAAFANIAPMV